MKATASRLMAAGLVAGCLACVPLTFGAAPAGAADPAPNLTVKALGATPATVPAGGSLMARDSLGNHARARAGRSTVGYYLSASGVRDARSIRLGRRSSKPLRPGRTQRGTKRLTLPATVRAGRYRLIACADDMRRVREASERDNCRAAKALVRVTGPPPLPPVAAAPAESSPSADPAPPVDRTAPAVTVSEPAAASTTTDQLPMFRGSAGTGSGDSASVTVKVYAGAATAGAPVQTLSATREGGGAWSATATSALPVGTYTVAASQGDTAGNTGTSAPVTFSTPAVMLAAGDIASCTQTGDSATAAILAATPADVVAVLGDNAYENGSAADYSDCYDPTWGFVKAKTRPAPGNHEYATAGAAGYFGYFGSVAGTPGQGWYSYDLGAWHVIVLNSSDACNPVSCAAGSAQETWLANDLRTHANACTLAYWHHPLFTSDALEAAGSATGVKPFWNDLYAAGADLVLNGHAHTYERFRPQRPDGTADDAGGIREIVSGTGGYTEHSVTSPAAANSQALNNDTFGVTQLTLRPGGYRWQFLPQAGKTFTDAGTGVCH